MKKSNTSNKKTSQNGQKTAKSHKLNRLDHDSILLAARAYDGAIEHFEAMIQAFGPKLKFKEVEFFESEDKQESLF